jgi:hypothetical protein
VSALRSFLAELQAAPPVQQALAAGTVIDGKPAAEHLVAIDLMFHELEHSPSEAAIAAYDAVVGIINSGAPLKQRLEAIAGCKPLLDCRR